MSRTLYICATVYHVYVMLQKISVEENIPDVCLETTIPNVEEIKNRLKQLDEIGSVSCISDVGWRFSNVARTTLQHILTKAHIHELDGKLGFISEYDDIRIFNDDGMIGQYLNDRRIYYHLIEDGLDCYKHFNESITKTNHPLIAPLLENIFGVAFDMGQSKYCLDVEVNDSTGLKTSFNCAIRCCPRTRLKEMANGLGRELLLRVFPLPCIEEMQDGILILTLPTDVNNKGESVTEKYLPRGTTQVDFIRKVMDKFPDRKCFIKPHPRDKTDYVALIPEAETISREIPVEMFTYDNGLHMYAAVTYVSTSLGSIDFAEKRFAVSPDVYEGGEVEPLDL